MPAPRLRKAVVAVAAMLIVAIVTTQRSATASRLSSDPTDVQDADTPQPQSGLRRLMSLMRGRRGDAVRDSANHRLLAQVAKPANASKPTNASKPAVAASVAAKVPDPKVNPKPAGKVVAPAKVNPKPAGKIVAPAKVNPKPAGKVATPAKVNPKPAGKVVPPKKAAPKSVCLGMHQKLCGGKCVDITFDRNNCGACDKRCGRGQVCDNGRIVQWPEDDDPCPFGYFSCDGQCCNLLNDPDHCGACNVTCATGQQCLGGTCQTVNEQPDKLARTANVKVNVLVKLAPGRTKCSSRGRSCYYPLFESNNNCGRCGVSCPRDACCIRGQCQCRRKRCLCVVRGQLKCLKPGEVCPSTRKMCPKPCKTKWCGKECCAGPYDVCYDSNNDGSCDKCCPLIRFSQKLNQCCPENFVGCKTGCCPACPAALCDTATGKVCCQTTLPGTSCQPVPGEKNDQCCATPLCQTGASTYQCCASNQQCKKPDGSTYAVCCPSGQVCGDTCCPKDATCYNDDGDAATSTKCCPKGSSVYPENPVAPNVKQVCCPAGQTGYPDANQQPACCITANYDANTNTCCDTALCSTAEGSVCCAQLDGAPPNSVCRPVGAPGGGDDLCCPLDFNLCGTQCCDPAASDPRNGQCFTDPTTGTVGCPPVSFVCVDDPASPNYNCEDGPGDAQFQCCTNQLGVNECIQLGTDQHCSDCNPCPTNKKCAAKAGGGFECVCETGAPYNAQCDADTTTACGFPTPNCDLATCTCACLNPNCGTKCCNGICNASGDDCCTATTCGSKCCDGICNATGDDCCAATTCGTKCCDGICNANGDDCCAATTCGTKCCDGICNATGDDCCTATTCGTKCCDGICNATDDDCCAATTCGTKCCDGICNANGDDCCAATTCGTKCCDGICNANGDDCCDTQPCGTKCCPNTDDQCYTDADGNDACCDKGLTVCNNVCCSADKNVCVSGECKECSIDSDCKDGKVCCGNTCVSPSDDKTCGGCTACPSNKQCTNTGGTNKCVCKRGGPYNAACDATGGCASGFTCNLDTCECTECKLIPADIYFLADNTGSMGSYINAVKNNAGQILTSLTSSINDLYTGGGAYRDRNSGFMFRNTANVGGGTSGAQSAINAWSANSGGDEPEGQLYALYQLATGSYGWRANSLKVVVWFGDAPGHNPICRGYITNNFFIKDPASDITFPMVSSALQAKGIKIIALSVGANRLDADNFKGDSPCTEVVVSNQASKLATATGGVFKNGVVVNTIVQAIIDALKEATCPSTSQPAFAAAARVAAPVIGTTPATN